MKTKTNWNTQPRTDTVAFSVLIATGMLLAWLAAAAPTPVAGPDTALPAAPIVTQAAVQPVDQANDSKIVVTARRLARNDG